MDPILQVTKDNIRNNFYFVGDALRNLFIGGNLPFSSPSIDSLRNFMENTNIHEEGAAAWRHRIMTKLR